MPAEIAVCYAENWRMTSATQARGARDQTCSAQLLGAGASGASRRMALCCAHTAINNRVGVPTSSCTCGSDESSGQCGSNARRLRVAALL